MQVLVENTIEIGKVLGRPERRRIIEIVAESPKNITDLKNTLKIRSYKNARNHVNKLINIGFVETIKAPYKEGVKIETNQEKFSKVFNEKILIDARNMFYFPVSHEELNKYIKDKKEVTEEEIRKKFPKIKKDMLRWYLLLFGISYDLKISIEDNKKNNLSSI
ncbi:MAG: winged helix-turn-helix domain-containing protein [Nanoarchaeota archaeon]